MEVEFKDADLFKRIMDTVGGLMADVSLDFTNTGFSIKAMSPDNVAMIMVEGTKDLFGSFNVDKDTKLSVSLDDLNNILKLLKKEDKLRLTDSKNRLNLDISGKNKMHFVIPLIDENYTAQKVPQLKFSAEVTMLSALIKEAIKAGFLVDDSLYVTIDGQRVILSARSEEKEFSEDLSINDNKEIFNIHSDVITRSKYSIEHLTKFLNSLDADKPVKLSLSNSYPLRLDYEINANAKMSFILANRIE
jgi:proliferating cell nuclear antigen PCNA